MSKTNKISDILTERKLNKVFEIGEQYKPQYPLSSSDLSVIKETMVRASVQFANDYYGKYGGLLYDENIQSGPLADELEGMAGAILKTAAVTARGKYTMGEQKKESLIPYTDSISSILRDRADKKFPSRDSDFKNNLVQEAVDGLIENQKKTAAESIQELSKSSYAR